MKEMLYEMRCLKSNEDMILALAGQFKQLSHEAEKFRLLNGIRNPWPLRCRCSALTNWATKSHSWEQVKLLGSCFPVKGMSYERNVIWRSYERNVIWSVVWKKCYMKCRMKEMLYEVSSERNVIWSCRTTEMLYNISFIRHSFHGKTWAQQIDLSYTVWLGSSVG